MVEAEGEPKSNLLAVSGGWWTVSRSAWRFFHRKQNKCIWTLCGAYKILFIVENDLCSQRCRSGGTKGLDISVPVGSSLENM